MKKKSAIRLAYFLLFVFYISNAYAIRKKIFRIPAGRRYDLTLYNAGKTYPAWLEIHHSGTRTLVGQYVGQGGSARPISKINFINGTVSFHPAPMGYRFQ
jgi:hypothetical protein